MNRDTLEDGCIEIIQSLLTKAGVFANFANFSAAVIDATIPDDHRTVAVMDCSLIATAQRRLADMTFTIAGALNTVEIKEQEILKHPVLRLHLKMKIG